MKTTSYNAHAFKVLLQQLESKVEGYNRNDIGYYELMAQEITRDIYGHYDEYEERYAINPRTLKRYWGKYVFGSSSKRYSPNSISLDLLSIACGFKNWDMYEKANGNTFVTNVLPYEQKLSFFNNGFCDATYSKPGDIFYFGDVSKFIALERVYNGFMVVDFKNVFAFNNFTELDLTGVEVHRETDDKLHIRLHYRILDLNHYLSSAYGSFRLSDAKNAKQDFTRKNSTTKSLE